MPNIQKVDCDTLKTTLAVIKPDALKHSRRILQIFMKNGFHILQRKRFQLSPELAAEFYKEYEKCKSYMILVLNLSEGPIEAVILSKSNAIYNLLDLVGPEKPSEARTCQPNSLRSIFGNCEDDYKNVIHASLDSNCARREINFFFPNFIIEPISIEMPSQICCVRRDIIEKLIDGLFDVTKLKPDELKTWLANWFIQNNPNRPVIYTSDTEIVCTPAKSSETVVCEDIPEDMDILKTHDRCGLKPCPECKDQSHKINLEKFLCCCNTDIQPTEIVNCPICDKMIVYSVPCGQGAKKKIPSESTTSSLTSSSSALSSCKCSVVGEYKSKTSSSTSCKCNPDDEPIDKVSGSETTETSSETNSDEECNCRKNT